MTTMDHKRRYPTNYSTIPPRASATNHARANFKQYDMMFSFNQRKWSSFVYFNLSLNSNQSPRGMSKPTSILKKKQEQKLAEDHFNESVTGWHQPTDLDLLPARPSYSPVRTPPKLRTYVVNLNKKQREEFSIIYQTFLVD